jgi:hypothetical protein
MIMRRAFFLATMVLVIWAGALAHAQSADSSQTAYRYQPSGVTAWSKELNISVARTDSGDQYHFEVEFTIPSVPKGLPGSAAMPDPTTMVRVYGYTTSPDGTTELPQKNFSDVAGSWEIGDHVHFGFNAPKDFANPVHRWSVQFCVGNKSRCVPSPNLLDDGPASGQTVAAGSQPHIRVENRSGVDFTSVVVNGQEYGDIRAGDRTNYHTMARAYRNASISLSTDSGPMAVRPTDYVGERQLADGNFTYVLTIRDGELLIECVTD